jgi:CHAT domain-containing protein
MIPAPRAAPVAEAVDDDLPRVWWCPTGPMTFLPLHAATHLGADGEGAAARFVSSYAPTLGQLLRARAAVAPDQGGRSVVVALSASPRRGLRRVDWSEGRAVARRLAPSVLLRGSRATAAAVTARLEDSAPWLHLACRGTQDAGDPAAGGLALHDEPLQTGALGGLRLTGAELAVLGDCDLTLTGTRLADEAVSLAAVLHRAGYRHVIGTLWAPPDEPGSGLAGQVYDQLGPPGGPAPGTAVALHRAVTALRRVHPDEPWWWAPYVHLGP